MKDSAEFFIVGCVDPDDLDRYIGHAAGLVERQFSAYIRKESVVAVVRYKNLEDNPTAESAAVFQVRLSGGHCLYALSCEGMDELMLSIGETDEAEWRFWEDDTPGAAT